MKGLALSLALLSSLAVAGPVLEFSASDPTWYTQNDTVMGGISSSRVRIEGGILKFTGQVRLENNGGFSGIRSNPGRFDLSGYSALRLRVKGDGKQYAFQLGTSTAGGVNYRAEFNTVAGQWTEVTIPLNTLRPTRFGRQLAGPALDRSKISFFGLMVGNGRAEGFALDVDWIRGE
ncbi:CIA30 family protein [Deinococcus arenicola]|uniref:CIA30 family protein n=1 Tax=Deinococcus arenicola TaxID=2994950 RepID=A0ABU4DTF9_9DEIO|nr:CIA30 family protein [Deinococcus sp. ZS9-10]MDV6375247.1 CIA30 family protein [Deinococcus sp. ZS9-10]